MVRIKGKVLILLSVFTLLMLWGCGGAEDNGELDVATEDAEELVEEEVVETEEPTEEVPTATPSPTPEPTATPYPAELSLGSDEIVFIEDALVVSGYSSPEDGWLAIWPDSNNPLEPEDALAFIEVKAGQDGPVRIPIDGSDLELTTIQIGLHGGRSNGEAAEFLANADNLLLIEKLEIETPTTQPMLITAAEVVTNEGTFRVDEVRSKGAGWLAIYDATKENLLGFKAVPAGYSTDHDVFVQWHNATTTLHVYLLADGGNVGEFEDGIDEPMKAGGELVTAEVSVGLPAEIVVFDQPMSDRAMIARVSSPVDGYLAVFGDSDGDGFPNTIVGSTPIDKGLTEHITVSLETGDITPQMIFSIYTDSDGDDEFDYFEDEPVLFSQGENDPSPLFVTARSDIEGLLVVDHLSSANMVRVDWVAAPIDAWVIVEKLDEEEQLVVGQARISAGLFHDIEIPLSGVSPGDNVRVLLHVNNPDPELFEPERNDFPLLADGRLVFVEFTLK